MQVRETKNTQILHSQINLFFMIFYSFGLFITLFLFFIDIDKSYILYSEKGKGKGKGKQDK